MICQTCHGNGYVKRYSAVDFISCPACGGCGEQHCCEGEQWSEREIEIEQVKK